MSFIGNIEPFSPVQSDIASYMERMEQLFACNNVNDDKKKAMFLTLIGAEAYRALKDLVSPDLPSSKTFDELKTTLVSHFNPKRLVIAERYKFYSAQQEPEEDIKSYATKLKNLSQHCDFNTFLNEALRDKFVCGLRSEAIKRKLLSEDNMDKCFSNCCGHGTSRRSNQGDG